MRSLWLMIIANKTWKEVKKHFSIILILSYIKKKDRGLAKSIMFGIKQATKDKIIVMDTDLTHDPKEIKK